MNLSEAMKLLSAISAIPVNNCVKHPEFRICHEIGKGYTLRTKLNSVNGNYRTEIDRIVDSYKLEIRESHDYLVIYGHS